MKQIFFKYIIITFTFIFCVSNALLAQDFYKEYKTYSVHNLYKRTSSGKKLVDSLIKRLRLSITAFENENKKPFFNTDTLCLVKFTGAETGFTSAIIWTKNASCYYRYTFDMENWKVVNPKLEIKTNAVKMLDSFSKEFRQSIETGDTSRYLKYADKHKVFDGSWVESQMAIVKNGKWVITTFPNNGWAIDY